jgi:hypothetical protein
MLLYDAMGEPQRLVVSGAGPRMDVTNVADYYYHHDKEYWKIGEDFPLCRPPFDSMWVEYRYPKETYSKEAGLIRLDGGEEFRAYVGCFVSNKVEFTDSDKTSDLGVKGVTIVSPKRPGTVGEWGIWGGIWIVDKSNDKAISFHSRLEIRFDIDEQGNLSNSYAVPGKNGATDEDVASNLYIFHPVFMAFSFANCKNIEIVDVKPSVKLNKRRVERGKRPMAAYSIVNVHPFGKSYSQQRRTVDGDGTGVALQIRRGSYARYGEQFGRGKLFGKYSGMFWRPQTAIGDEKFGKIDHGYAVQIPDSEVKK